MRKSIRTIMNTFLPAVFTLTGFMTNSYAQPKPDPSDKATGVYVIDKKESVVTWKGSMAFTGKGQHNGFVYFSEGKLMLEKGQLSGGTVVVDMNTIEDEQHRSDNGLIDHLKDLDFFDVKNFPLSTFEITRITPGTSESIEVTGNLTIKGITHAVTFPAKIELKDGALHANGKLTIDRTKWNVYYKSGKFFSNLADEAISDSIEFDMKIVARK